MVPLIIRSTFVPASPRMPMRGARGDPVTACTRITARLPPVVQI